MDPHAGGTATPPHSEHSTSALPATRRPASRARRGLLIAAFIGAGLVVSFGLVQASSTLGLVSFHGSFDVAHGDPHTLPSHRSFELLPVDDSAFEAWLRAQPGVETVEIRRAGGNAL